MEWNRSETFGLAKTACTICHGEGLRRSALRGKQSPCKCVLRAIFRACHSRFRECIEKEKPYSKVSYQFLDRGGKALGRSWGRRDEEYVADFCLVSRRYLDDFEYKIFRFHFLLGADWRLCCRQLHMERGLFFHAVYRIQQKLGRIYRELQPYSLYPLDEYFGGRTEKAITAQVIPINRFVTVRPPLLKVA